MHLTFSEHRTRTRNFNTPAPSCTSLVRTHRFYIGTFPAAYLGRLEGLRNSFRRLAMLRTLCVLQCYQRTCGTGGVSLFITWLRACTSGIYPSGRRPPIRYLHILYLTTLLASISRPFDALFRQRPPASYVPGYLTVTMRPCSEDADGGGGGHGGGCGRSVMRGEDPKASISLPSTEARFVSWNECDLARGLGERAGSLDCR